MTIKFFESDNAIKRRVVIINPDETEFTIEGVQFTYLSEDEFREILEKEGDEGISSVVTGWGAFKDLSGSQIKFNQKNLDELVKYSPARQALIGTYGRAIMGLDTKNSLVSQGVGQVLRHNHESKKKPAGKKRKTASRKSA